MRLIKQIQPLRKILQLARNKKKAIGFVPTMGALHQGHAALLRQCKRENDVAVLSIFVNPTQFGPKEDFTKYPRDKKADVSLAKKENVDIIWHPSVEEVYPARYLTTINVEEITGNLCGRSRPGHFRGVATVVGKLLNVVQPTTLYLGQKDAQQCAVIQKMITDLNFPVKVRIVPTVREADGLAMSSRNRYLSVQQRAETPVLYQSLLFAKRMIDQGERSAQRIAAHIRNTIKQQTSGEIDYIECVDPETLQPISILNGKILIALAVKFGAARLIDNIIVKVT